MKILSIDTSHGICSTALAENGKLISVKTDPEPSRQAERLFLNIDDILKENQLTYIDINAIAADIGPGSFTGVRIGLAATRGIALAANIPVIGVTGFEALVYAAKHQGIIDDLLVVLDARRGQVFAQFFSNDANSEELLLDYSEITEILPNKNITIIGDGAALVEPILQNHNINYSVIDNLKIPDAGMVAMAAFEKINSGNYSKNPAPLYIRKPDAKLPKQAGVE